ncbi:hypothetical protein [Larkinella soli]|uniref:hypothetical protein n=1 Tax=Larkinella soli TaxID=1770527 RepID=UPI000FFC3F85|nr:hypothetical protein [Larkinella soli]
MSDFDRHRYSFTNHFEQAGLKSRIRMMNQDGDGIAWWRYAAIWLLTVLVFMACQNWRREEPVQLTSRVTFPVTNPTRALAAQLAETNWWGTLLEYYPRRLKGDKASVFSYGEPFVLGVKGETLSILEPYGDLSRLYINGKEASPSLLSRLSMEYVQEIFILHQYETSPESDPKPYRIMMQIGNRPADKLPGREKLEAILQASALSSHPLGATHSYTMNKLLEATFFGYRDALVQRTKNQHLKVYDEFRKDINVFINGIPVDPKEVETVHVREVDRLYTAERPFTEWLRTGNRKSRYVLYIQTTPKRAQRDSSYYVFSPFYSGDF